MISGQTLSGGIFRRWNSMNIVKEEAKKMIERLPDNVTWDDIMYELYVKKKISVGLKAAEEGRVVSHKDAKKRLLSK
jgi:hypothetical protein